jgi:hypothetical protein
MTTTESELERTVREEQEAHDAAQRQTAGDVPPDPDGNALFDKEGYIPEALALPKIDGEQIDKIGIRFKASRILLERSDEADVAMVRDLKLGSTVTLLVECDVGVPAPAFTTAKEGELDALVLYRELRVTGVYKPVPEQLSELRDLPAG